MSAIEPLSTAMTQPKTLKVVFNVPAVRDRDHCANRVNGFFPVPVFLSNRRSRSRSSWAEYFLSSGACWMISNTTCRSPTDNSKGSNSTPRSVPVQVPGGAVASPPHFRHCVLISEYARRFEAPRCIWSNRATLPQFRHTVNGLPAISDSIGSSHLRWYRGASRRQPERRQAGGRPARLGKAA